MVQVYPRVIPLSMEHEIAGLEWSFQPLAFNQEVNEIVYLAPYFKQKKQMTNGAIYHNTKNKLGTIKFSLLVPVNTKATFFFYDFYLGRFWPLF